LATAAGFGDAVPALEGRPAVRPRSTHECRTCGRLATHVLAERLAAAAASVAPAIAFSQHGRCSKCGGKLRPVEPFAALPRRLWTRVALDRHTASAAEGQLHTLEVIDPDGLSGGLRLRCEVRGAGPEAAALLHGLHGQRVAIGHGRGVGLGRMRVCVEPLPRTPDIAARVVRLHDAVRHVAGTSASVEAQWAALMLTGPWTRACGGEHPLWADSDAELVAAFPLRGVVAGFDLQANAERAPRHAWLPGSVFAYRFAAERPAAWWRDLQAQGLAGVGPGAVRGEGRFELNPDLCLEEARP
jgi:hypothetical protein